MGKEPMVQHDEKHQDEYRDDQEDRRDNDSCLTDRLRREVLRYEEDLRELAKT